MNDYEQLYKPIGHVMVWRENRQLGRVNFPDMKQ